MTAPASERFVAVVEAVTQVLADVPAGRVCSYGDIAAVIGSGPRQVAAAMASGAVVGPWWRVIRSDGTLPPALWERALGHYRTEGTPLRTARGERVETAVDMAQARWSFPL